MWLDKCIDYHSDIHAPSNVSLETRWISSRLLLATPPRRGSGTNSGENPMKRTKSNYLALLAVVLSPMAANADVVDFEDVAVSTGTFVGGYPYSVSSNGCDVAGTDATWSGLENGYDGSDNGTTHFFGSDVTMTCGGTFDLISFDLGVDWNILASPLLVRVDLFYAAGGSNWVTAPVGPDFGFSTWSAGPTSFGLSSVVFSTDGTLFSVDNLVVRAVPEPGTLALLGIGLLGMGAARRRKKA